MSQSIDRKKGRRIAGMKKRSSLPTGQAEAVTWSSRREGKQVRNRGGRGVVRRRKVRKPLNAGEIQRGGGEQQGFSQSVSCLSCISNSSILVSVLIIMW